MKVYFSNYQFNRNNYSLTVEACVFGVGLRHICLYSEIIPSWEPTDQGMTRQTAHLRSSVSVIIVYQTPETVTEPRESCISF